MNHEIPGLLPPMSGLDDEQRGRLAILRQHAVDLGLMHERDARYHHDDEKVLAKPDAATTALQQIADIAHAGGLEGMTEGDALVRIRRLCVPWWDKTQKHLRGIKWRRYEPVVPGGGELRWVDGVAPNQPQAFNPDARYAGAMIGLADETATNHMVQTMMEQCEQTLSALGAPPDAFDFVVVTIRRVRWSGMSVPPHLYVSWEYDRKKNMPYIMP